MGWHETFCVDLGNGRWARFCAFNSKVHYHGNRANVHKGKLFKSFEDSKVVVRVYHDNDECQADIEKQRVAEKLLKNFPRELKEVRVIPKYCASVSEIAVIHKWFSRNPLQRGTPVSIQDRKNTQDIRNFRRLLQPPKCELGRSNRKTLPLLELGRKSVTFSNGSYVVVGTKGVIKKKKGVVTYWLTSLVVHSKDQRFGQSDEGPDGIARFLKTSGLDVSFQPHPALQPTAPPLEESVPVKGEKAHEEEESRKGNHIFRGVDKRAIAARLTELQAKSDLLPLYDSILRASSNVSRWGPPPPYSFAELTV